MARLSIAFDYLIDGKDLDFKIMVEVNNVNIIFDLLHRSNLVTVLSESTTILEKGMRAIPIDAADNEMAGMVHFKDYTMMRGLVMDFNGDDNVYDIKDQWMFGHHRHVESVGHLA